MRSQAVEEIQIDTCVENESQYRRARAARLPNGSPAVKSGHSVKDQMVEEAKVSECAQRVQVAMERHAHGKRVKIRVENYDAGLGWYTSGSLTVPLHQLPLLEQAVADMRSAQREDDSDYGKIIPFPCSQIESART